MRSHARRCPSLSFASVRKGARLEARDFGAEVNEDAGFRMRPDHMDDTREQIDASIGSASSLPAALACGEESAPPGFGPARRPPHYDQDHELRHQPRPWMSPNETTSLFVSSPLDFHS